MNMAYAEKLKDPRWQRRRLEVFNRDRWTCRECGDTETTLNIHHHYYIPNKEPWEYPDEAFVTLCEDCHKAAKTIKISQAFNKYISILEGQIENEYSHELSRKIDCVLYLSENI